MPLALLPAIGMHAMLLVVAVGNMMLSLCQLQGGSRVGLIGVQSVRVCMSRRGTWMGHADLDLDAWYQGQLHGRAPCINTT